MTSIVLIQARTSSSRLPAKVSLPLQGIPLSVLAARRASNTGREVIIVTSQDQSDDAFARMLIAHGQKCFRGSLGNTLDRFVGALADYVDDTIVVRLTADNVFPDGGLIDEMTDYYVSRNLDYLCSTGTDSGLPYGASVEIVRLFHLREASKLSNSDFDREHVTPYIVRKYGRKVFSKYKALDKEDHRCTIDTLDDYLFVQKVFEDVADPVTEPLLDLIARIDKTVSACTRTTAGISLIIGGAQFGSRYGIANQSGQPSSQEVSAVIKMALENGVSMIDTASAYGESEELIGKTLCTDSGAGLEVITKLSDMSNCPIDASAAVVSAFVESSVFRSCSRLGKRTLDCVLLHRAAHLDSWHGTAWNSLSHLVRKGVISKLGVSVQSPDEFIRVLREPSVSVIQLPFNVLDNRWESAIDELLEVRREREIAIHVRSVFLQGLLLTNESMKWRRANCDSSRIVVQWLDDQSKSCGRESIVDFCLAYVRSQNWISGILVGMETVSQLADNIRYFNKPELSVEEVEGINRSRPIVKEDTLNPSLWNVG